MRNLADGAAAGNLCGLVVESHGVVASYIVIYRPGRIYGTNIIPRRPDDRGAVPVRRAGRDSLHDPPYKGRYKTRAVYTVPALNSDDKKRGPGLYLQKSEGVRCRLSVFVALQNRGVQAIRRISHITNSLKTAHHPCRKLTQTGGGFTDDDSLLKRPRMGIRDWNLVISPLAIFCRRPT